MGVDFTGDVGGPRIDRHRCSVHVGQLLQVGLQATIRKTVPDRLVRPGTIFLDQRVIIEDVDRLARRSCQSPAEFRSPTVTRGRFTTRSTALRVLLLTNSACSTGRIDHELGETSVHRHEG